MALPIRPDRIDDSDLAEYLPMFMPLIAVLVVGLLTIVLAGSS